MTLDDEVDVGMRIMHPRGVTDDGWSYVAAADKLVDRVLDIDREIGTSQDAPLADALRECLFTRLVVPGTPLLSAGRRDSAPPATACTVIDIRTGVFDGVRTALEHGAGVGVDLSSFEDPLAVIGELNTLVRQVDTTLRASRRRPVAAMGTLSSRHPRVMDFIRLKRDADFLQWRFNLSIRLEGDLTQWDHLVAPIAESSHFCGEPGVLFWDRFTADNPLPDSPPLSTAPCAEVALAPGEGCVFTYINLAKLWTVDGVDWHRLEHAAALSVRMLDAAVEMQAPGDVTAVSRATRRVGVGVMGFADLCILGGIVYGSPSSVELARRVAATITASALRASTLLAEGRGGFTGFERSRWADRQWTEALIERAVGDCLPDQVGSLAAAIAHSGLRHSHLVAFPPTGNSSRVAGVSQAMEPRRERVRDDLRPLSVYRAGLHHAATAHPEVDVIDLDVTPDQHIDIQAAFQRSTVDAVSKTVNAPRDASVEDVERLIRRAWVTNCKGVTVFRDGCLEDRGL